MLPKFTRSEAKEIAAVLQEEKRKEDLELTDEQIAEAINAPLKLTAEEKKFLRKKEHQLPSVAELKAKFKDFDEKVISPDFGSGTADGGLPTSQGHRVERTRIAASRMDRPRPGDSPDVPASADLIRLVELGIKELGVEPAVYIRKVVRQLGMPLRELRQMTARDLDRFEKRLIRDIAKKHEKDLGL